MWTPLIGFGVGVASALLPWINAELMLLALAAPMTTATRLTVLVLAVTAGQVCGKSALYWVARGAHRAPSARVTAAIDKWRSICVRRPAAAMTMMIVSATFGLPPFYITTLVAGAVKISFLSFLAAAIGGRLLHFGAVALVPTAIEGLFH